MALKGYATVRGGAINVEAADTSQWQQLDDAQQAELYQWLSKQEGSFWKSLAIAVNRWGLSNKQLAYVYRHFVPTGAVPDKKHMESIQREWDKLPPEEQKEITDFVNGSSWNLFQSFSKQLQNNQGLSDKQLSVVRKSKGQNAPSDKSDSRWQALGKEPREKYVQYLSNRSQDKSKKFIHSLYEQVLKKDYLSNQQLDVVDEIMRKDPLHVKGIDKEDTSKSPAKTNLKRDKLVGHRIRVWVHNKYFEGVVKRFKQGRQFEKYLLHLDDGTEEWVLLEKEKIEHIKPPAGQKGASPRKTFKKEKPKSKVHEPKGKLNLQFLKEMPDATGRTWKAEFMRDMDGSDIHVYLDKKFWNTFSDIKRAQLDTMHYLRGL